MDELLAQIRGMSTRDKMLIVTLVFLLILAGFYVGYKKIEEDHTMLADKNAALIVQKDTATATVLAIGEYEEQLSEKTEEVEVLYSEVSDHTLTPVAFEKVFLGWISNREINVTSFSYTEPAVQSVSYSAESTSTYPMEDYAQTFDTYSDDYEEVESESVDLSAQEAILSSTYNYSMELSKYEYTRLLDKINDLPSFVTLKSTSFTESEFGDSSPGTASVTIIIYSYDKPKVFQQDEDKSFFKFRTNGGFTDEYTEDTMTGNTLNTTNTGIK